MAIKIPVGAEKNGKEEISPFLLDHPRVNRDSTRLMGSHRRQSPSSKYLED
jgi:hypothetical protein